MSRDDARKYLALDSTEVATCRDCGRHYDLGELMAYAKTWLGQMQIENVKMPEVK